MNELFRILYDVVTLALANEGADLARTLPDNDSYAEGVYEAAERWMGDRGIIIQFRCFGGRAIAALVDFGASSKLHEPEWEA